MSSVYSTNMRAVLFREFGGPRVLELSEAHPRPTRRKGELLVEVHATSVNPVDCKTRRGDVPRLLVAKPKVLGGDVAGVVVEADQGSRFRPGTRVACLSDGFDFRKPYGSYAEFISVPEQTVADLPGSISFEAGAALPLVTLTAMQALDPLALKPGQRVLIHAGAGGVGSVAIQLAKARGLHVTTTCSTRNVEFVTKELGADVAIDYTEESFDVVCRDAPFDCVLDFVAGDYEARSLKVLKPSGTYVAFLARINILALLKGLLLSFLRRGPRYRLVMVSPNGEQMRAAINMVQEGKLRPIIDRVLPLAQASEAHEYVEKGHTRGKVLLKVVDD